MASAISRHIATTTGELTRLVVGPTRSPWPCSRDSSLPRRMNAEAAGLTRCVFRRCVSTSSTISPEPTGTATTLIRSPLGKVRPEALNWRVTSSIHFCFSEPYVKTSSTSGWLGLRGLVGRALGRKPALLATRSYSASCLASSVMGVWNTNQLTGRESGGVVSDPWRYHPCLFEGSRPEKSIGDLMVVWLLAAVSFADAAFKTGSSASLWAPGFRNTASTVSAPVALTFTKCTSIGYT